MFSCSKMICVLFVLLFMITLVQGFAYDVVDTDDYTESTTSIIKEDFENCLPSSAVLVDQYVNGYWDARIYTWNGPTDKMLCATPATLPDITYYPGLSGLYNIYVGTRCVNWATDFEIGFTDEPGIGFREVQVPMGYYGIHWNKEIYLRRQVSLNVNSGITFRSLGNASYIDYLRFVPLITKNYAVKTDTPVTVCSETGMHFAFPGVAQAADGRILVVSREGTSHTSSDGNIVLSRSTNANDVSAWNAHVVIKDTASDLRDPNILKMSNGTLIVTYGDMSLGSMVIRSTDNGYTWSGPYSVPVFSPKGVVQGADGYLYYCGIRTSCGVNYVDVVRSTDSGSTWEDYCNVAVSRPWGGNMSWEFYDEPDMAILPDGRWIVAHRVDLDGYIRFSTSDSSGAARTWSLPTKSQIFGHPAHMLRLWDGRLLMTYSHRRETIGIRACFSSDNGNTWDIENEAILQEQAGSTDIGYPHSIQLSNGYIFTVYYLQQTVGQVPTIIQGKLWY